MYDHSVAIQQSLHFECGREIKIHTGNKDGKLTVAAGSGPKEKYTVRRFFSIFVSSRSPPTSVTFP
jgi:hypothetical protein